MHQRPATAIAFNHTARTMFTMAPMFASRTAQLKMPRLDAYS
jgi:hypothetical protein